MPEPELMRDLEKLPDDLRVLLAQLSPRELNIPVRGEAAVLLPILLTPPEPQLLLTRRTETVGTHKGQISFPGGKRDRGDLFPVETALRETQEELGVSAKHFEVLGCFHEYLSITSYKVAAVVAVSHGELELHPNPEEVAAVLQIPLRFFLETRPREETRKKLGRTVPVYFYDHDQDTVWGLTAAIIRDFCQLLKSLKPNIRTGS